MIPLTYQYIPFRSHNAHTQYGSPTPMHHTHTLHHNYYHTTSLNIDTHIFIDLKITIIQSCLYSLHLLHVNAHHFSHHLNTHVNPHTYIHTLHLHMHIRTHYPPPPLLPPLSLTAPPPRLQTYTHNFTHMHTHVPISHRPNSCPNPTPLSHTCTQPHAFLPATSIHCEM